MRPAPFLSLPTHRRFSCHALACALGGALLLASACAGAHTFCVSTAVELQNALDDSGNGGTYNGENNFIYIVKGTYKVGPATGGQAFHYQSTAATGQILLYGGYNAACTVQTKKAALTVLDGNGIAQVLTIHRSATNVVVSNLTIQNGETTLAGGGLVVNDHAGDNSGADLDDLIIRNNHTTDNAGGLLVFANGNGNDLYLKNNVITGNSADGDFGAGEVIGNTSVSSLYNNTVARNSAASAGSTGGLYYGGAASNVYIGNNIFWNNTTCGLRLGSSLSKLFYNDVGTICGFAPYFGSTGNVAVSPDFVDAVGGNFHLAGTSPLIGAVPTSYSSTDPEGNVSAVGGAMDMGAYYETIFTDGVEGN